MNKLSFSLHLTYWEKTENSFSYTDLKLTRQLLKMCYYKQCVSMCNCNWKYLVFLLSKYIRLLLQTIQECLRF
jgi:hypothetical protein